MYEAFQKEYPNIKVDIETVGFDDYFTQMQIRVAGGTAPDCYELNIENFAAYAAKGVLAEITGVDTSGFNQTALDAFKVDGKQYGLPGSFSNVVLFYNKDLLDQAGTDYPDDSWTWDDVQKAAEKIRALGDNIYGIYAPITFNEFFKVAAQYGGALLNSDKTEFTINSPENQKAAEMMVGRVLDSNVQPTEAQMGGMSDWDLPAITDQTVLNGYLKQTPPDNRQAVFDSLDYLVTPPVIEDYSLMSDIITMKLGEAASGKISEKDALDQAQQECESRINLK